MSSRVASITKRDWGMIGIFTILLPESIEIREVKLEPSSAANRISLSLFCYINPLSTLLGDLAKIGS